MAKHDGIAQKFAKCVCNNIVCTRCSSAITTHCRLIVYSHLCVSVCVWVQSNMGENMFRAIEKSYATHKWKRNTEQINKKKSKQPSSNNKIRMKHEKIMGNKIGLRHDHNKTEIMCTIVNLCYCFVNKTDRIGAFKYAYLNIVSNIVHTHTQAKKLNWKKAC